MRHASSSSQSPPHRVDSVVRQDCEKGPALKYHLVGIACAGLGISAVAETADEEYLRPKAYVSFSVGATTIDETDLQDLTLAGTGNDVNFDPGFGFHAAIGHQLFHPLRVEFEFSYHENDLDDIRIGANPTVDLDGDYSSVGFFINALFDIQINEVVSYYGGAGAGAAQVELDSSADLATLGIGTGTLNDDDFVFAYQAMTGLSFHVNDLVVVTAGYRLSSSEDPEFNGIEFDAPLVHSFEVGMRFEF